MLGAAEYVFEDLEGKSSSESLRTPVASGASECQLTTWASLRVTFG